MSHRKILLFALGAPVVLAALLLLVINVYVQSSSVQNRISAGLHDALGIDVTIRRISYTPWGGVRLSGVRIAGEEGRPDLFTAKSFTAKIRLSSMFGRDLLVDEVRVQEPEITLSPGLTLLPTPGEDVASVTPQPQPDPGPMPAGEIVEQSPPPASATPEQPRTTTVQRAYLDDGRLTYLDDHRRPVVRLTGIDVESQLAEAPDATGTLQIASVILDDAIEFTEFTSPFHYKNGLFKLSEITAEFAGGTVDGTFVWKERDPEAPAELFVHFKNASLPVLLMPSGMSSDRFKGSLSGSFLLRALPGKPESVHGAGKVSMVGGEISQVDFLKTIGEALKIEEIAHLRLDTAEAEYKVRGGEVRLERLYLATTNLKLEARGWIREGGRLDMDAKLFLNEKIQKKLPRLAKSNLEKADEHYAALDFDISGTLDRPRTNLIERFIGEKLEKEVNRVLRSFFGGSSGPSIEDEVAPLPEP